MMEPDDFRACLISMGYDLVSEHPSPPSQESHQCPRLRMAHLLCTSYLHIHVLISSSHPLGLGRIILFHTGAIKGSER